MAALQHKEGVSPADPQHLAQPLEQSARWMLVGERAAEESPAGSVILSSACVLSRLLLRPALRRHLLGWGAALREAGETLYL